MTALCIMEISVIIPTYKPKEYLWECLQSLAAQTLDRNLFEAIIVLNGCNEPYYSQIKTYIDQTLSDLNIQYIHTEIGGVSYARNIGLDRAKGKYITFIDDDDYISPQYLEELYKQANEDTIVLAYPYAFNDGEPNIQFPYSLTSAYQYCIQNQCNTINSMARKYFSGPCMKLIPMNYIQARRFDTRFRNGEDSLFMFLISNKFKTLQFTSTQAIYYRRYRLGSAYLSTTRVQRLCNSIKLIASYTRIYLPNIKQYNFLFYFTRILGSIRSIIQK